MVFGPAGNRQFLGSGRPRRPQKPFQKVMGEAPPSSGIDFGATGAAQTPKIGDFRPAQKPCIKNPSVLLLVVLRFFVDPELVRDGRETSAPTLAVSIPGPRGLRRGSIGHPSLSWVPEGSRTFKVAWQAGARRSALGRPARRVRVCVCVCAHMSGSGTDAHRLSRQAFTALQAFIALVGSR